MKDNKNVKQYKAILKKLKVKSVSPERLKQIYDEIQADSRKVTNIPDEVMRMRFTI